MPALVKIGLTVLLALGLLPSVPMPAAAGDVPLTARHRARSGDRPVAGVRAARADRRRRVRRAPERLPDRLLLRRHHRPAERRPQHDAGDALRLAGDARLPGDQRPSRAAAGAGGVLRRPADRRRHASTPRCSAPCATSSAWSSSSALRLAAPIVIVLLLVELAIGLISRTAPSLNFHGHRLSDPPGRRPDAGRRARSATVPAVTNSMLERSLTLGAALALAFR